MKKQWRSVALLLGLGLIGWSVWHWAAWRRQAAIGAGFAARVVCGCRYVQGRDLANCRTDLRGLEGMALIRVTDQPQDRIVTAAVPLLASRSAHAVPGFGCTIDRPE